MELLRALGVLAEPPDADHERVARLLGLRVAPDAAAHTDAMVWQLPPYASVHLGDDGMLGGEARDRVAGFLRSLDVDPPAEPDHLTTLLGFYADLVAREDAAAGSEERLGWRRARTAMLWEHLLSWLPVYLDEMRARAPAPYPAWAQLLDEVLVREVGEVGPPPAVPLALREAAPLPDPRDGDVDGFLTGLLAPVRSGTIVNRAVLAAAARDLGLGVRLGERRFVLRSLLAQDAAVTLRWLADHAGSVAGSWARRPATLAPVADHWSGRAAATSRLLHELAGEAGGSVPPDGRDGRGASRPA